jgi:hypothetical protein
MSRLLLLCCIINGIRGRCSCAGRSIVWCLFCVSLVTSAHSKPTGRATSHPSSRQKGPPRPDKRELETLHLLQADGNLLPSQQPAKRPSSPQPRNTGTGKIKASNHQSTARHPGTHKLHQPRVNQLPAGKDRGTCTRMVPCLCRCLCFLGHGGPFKPLKHNKNSGLNTV